MVVCSSSHAQNDAMTATTMPQPQIGVKRITASSAGIPIAATMSLFFMIGSSRLSFSRVRRSFHAAKAPVAPLKLRQRRVHVALGKVRPEHIGEIELGIRALPGQEVAQALLAARADDEVGIRNAAGIQVAADELLRELGAVPALYSSA